MSQLVIAEAVTVQFPMVRHATEIGWMPLAPAVALQKRRGEEGPFLYDELEAKLAALNPWLTPEKRREVIDRLEAIPATIEGNREMLGWLRGARSVHDEGERRQRPVRLVDFADPLANAFHVSWEWTLRPPARKANRADAIFLVNGVPVAIVEHKNPKDGDAIDRAVVQLRRYEAETPELIGAAQLFNVTHLLDYRYGVTWNASRREMARWKQAPEETYRFAVQSFFERAEFLRTLGEWILFYVKDGETRKSVLREHQTRAIGRILDRCADPDRRRGLIWHTQGSGKTFTLLTAARLLLSDRARFGEATAIVVIDRIELEGQLRGWVDRLLGEMQGQDIGVFHAASRAELQTLLDADRRGLIVAMIHKFDEVRKDSCVRDNVVVLIDEAHRSVARELGTYLMAALPNATIIGFTGTPIDRTARGEGTFKIFGAEDERGYLDKYSIAESIADETTVPIRHMLAPSEMTVPAERLDREFFEFAREEDVTDVDELNRVLDRAVALKTFLKADDRVAKVAAFVAGHYRENVLPLGYKAFLVAVDREACAKYKRALDALLPPEWTSALYAENAADVVERPLTAELQLSKAQEDDARARFKRVDENPKILIVTDKLLTGYDAPPLYCLYLDKPMRDHVLLQAVARVNRPYEDEKGQRKRIGLIVDFVGVLRELRKALRFDSADVSGMIEDLDLLMHDFAEKIAAARTAYLESDAEGLTPDERLERIVFGRFIDPEERKTFYEAYREIEALWEILSPAAALRDHVDTFKRLATLYATVRNAYRPAVGPIADLAAKTRRLVEESAVQSSLGTLGRSVTFDVETLRALRAGKGPDEGKVMSLVRGLNEAVEAEPYAAPILLPLKERAERVIKDLESRRVAAGAALDELALLAEERQEAVKQAEASGIGLRAFGVFWRLRDDPTFRATGIDVMGFARHVHALFRQLPNADQNPDERRRFRTALYRPLLGLPPEARAGRVDEIMALLFP